MTCTFKINCYPVYDPDILVNMLEPNIGLPIGVDQVHESDDEPIHFIFDYEQEFDDRWSYKRWAKALRKVKVILDGCCPEHKLIMTINELGSKDPDRTKNQKKQDRKKKRNDK